MVKESFLWNMLIKLQKAIVIGTSILIVLLLIIALVSRYLFDFDIYGIEELLLLPIFWLYFIGASYASYEDSHITGDLVSAYIKKKGLLCGVKSFARLITLIASVVFLVWSFQYFLWSYNNGSSTSLWNIPLYLAYLSVFIGFILMSLYTLIYLISNVKSFIGK